MRGHNYSTLVCNTHSYVFCKYVHNTPMHVRCTHEPQNTSALVTHVLWLCVFRTGVLSTLLHISAFSTHVRCFFTNCASIKTFTIYRIHTSVLLFHNMCVLTNLDVTRGCNIFWVLHSSHAGHAAPQLQPRRSIRGRTAARRAHGAHARRSAASARLPPPGERYAGCGPASKARGRPRLWV